MSNSDNGNICQCTLCHTLKKQNIKNPFEKFRYLFKESEDELKNKCLELPSNCPDYLKKTCFGYDWYFTDPEENLVVESDYEVDDFEFSSSDSYIDSDLSESEQEKIRNEKMMKKKMRKTSHCVKCHSIECKNSTNERCYVKNCFFHKGPTMNCSVQEEQKK